MQKKGFKRKLKQTLAFSLVAAMLISLMPSDLSVFADQASPTDAIENTEDESSDVITQNAEDEKEQQTTAVSEETTEEVTEGTTESATEAVTEETAEKTEETEESEESAPVEVIPTFDTFYDGVSVAGLDFSSCELLIATDDAGIFTQDTEVVSEYNGIYLTRYPDATQTMNAYSYYYTRAALVEVNTSIKASDEENVVEAAENSEDEDTSDDGEDDQQTYESIDEIPNEGHGEADLSNLNNSNDAFSVVDDMTAGNYTGYIALIDTGASGSVVKKSVSVLGDDGADYNGHGSGMAEAIASANPDAKVLSIKALDNNAIGTVADVYTAIEYAIDANVSVINLSMSSIATSDSDLLRTAISDATNKGIKVVASAGNRNSNASYYTPGNIESVFTIGACDADGNKIESSNYGTIVDYYVVADSTSTAAAKFSAYVVKGIDYAIMQAEVFSTLKSADDDSNNTDNEEQEPIDEDSYKCLLLEANRSWGWYLNSAFGSGSGLPSNQQVNITSESKPSWAPSKIVSSCTTVWIDDIGQNQYFSGHATDYGTLSITTDDYTIYGINSGSMANVACACYDHTAVNAGDQTHNGVVPGRNVYRSMTNVEYYYAGTDGTWYYYACGQYADGYSDGTYQKILTYIAIKKNPEPHYIGATKVDAETGAPVPGIRIGIYTSQSMATTPVGVITTNSAGNASVNLGTTTDEQKTYYLYEVGYTSDCPAKYRNTANFGTGMAGKYLGSVQSKSTLTYTSYTQIPSHTGIAIYKYDANTSEAIGGVKFGIYSDAACTNKLTELTTGADGKVVYELPFGTTAAYAKELSVPANIVLDTTVRTLVVRTVNQPISYAVIENAGGVTRILNEHEIYIELTKRSQNPDCTDGNENYDVRDAQYTFYPTDADANNNTNAIGTLTVSGTDPKVAVGRLEVTDDMDTDNNDKMIETRFYFKETTPAADGYEIDTEVHHIDINPASVDSSGTFKGATVARQSVVETPTMDPITLTITKQGADGNDPTGANTLAGAQFTVWFYDKKVTNTFDNSWTPTRTYVFQTKDIGTDANGKPIYGINFNDIEAHEISGYTYDYYYDTTTSPAKIAFPEGFLKIQETTAPAGYTMTGAFTATDMNGNDINAVAGDTYIVLKANDDGIVSTENILVKDDSFNKDDKPIRADIELTKVDEDDNAMEGVTFKIERTDVTPHEFHYVMTDENGYTSTKASYTTSHSNNTNPAFPGEAKAGIWFGDTNNIDDTYGALPYGDYTITEMRSLANAGKQLETSRKITRDEIAANDGGVITVFDPDATNPDDKNWNMAKPTLKTKAKVVETSDNTVDSQTLAQAGSNIDWTNQTIEDTITFTKLRADSTEYTFLTELMVVDKDGNAEIYTNNGKEYRQIASYTSPSDYEKSIYEVDGEIVVNIEHVDPTGLEEQQKKLVVYESLYYGHYDTLEELDEAIANGTVATRYPVYSDDDDMDFFPVEHKDNDDDYQTVRPGDIHTTAEDSVTLDHIGKNSAEAKLTDRIYYTGLTAGVEYTISGKLVVKEGTDWTNIKYDPKDPDADAEGFVTTTTTSGNGTAYFLKDADGNEVTASKTFTPAEPEGYVDVVFEFDASLLEGKTTVAFEALSYNDKVITIHMDLDDEDQSVHYPLIHTTSRNAKADLTKATDADEEALAKQVSATDGESFIDTIHYENLIANRTYVAKGILMDKATGKVMQDASGKDITAEFTFKTDEVGEVVIDTTPDAVDYILADGTKLDLSSDHANYLCNGDVDLEFSGYDFSNLANKTGVVFEEIYLQTTTSSTDSSGNPVSKTELSLVGEHKDITDVDQFIYYVEVGTKAEDATTESKVVPYNKDTVIEDTVSYKNVIPGKEYTLTATLVVKNDQSGKYKDGDKLLDKDGKVITVTHTFTPEKANGEEIVKIPVNTAPYRDMEIVVFEGLQNKFGIEIAAHNDLTDEDQTIEVPGGGTTAKDKATGDKVSSASKSVTIVDTITYRNLQPGREYTATGTLYKKSTKEPLKDADGKNITNTVKFTPKEKNGTVDVDFTIDASLLAGESIVVFEDVLDKKETVFIHHDIEDEDQTVDIPKIGTTATVDNGKKSATASKKTTIVDKVEYKNLVADGTKEYTVTGYLYDKSTGEKLIVNGQYVKASKTFKPEKSDGFIELSFTFDASGLATDIVVFEYMYHNEKEVATHTEIEDEGQTVTITPPTSPPKTGMIIILTVIGLMAIGGAGMLIFRRKTVR